MAEVICEGMFVNQQYALALPARFGQLELAEDAMIRESASRITWNGLIAHRTRSVRRHTEHTAAVEKTNELLPDRTVSFTHGNSQT
jgi:hypothetical protein